MSENGEKNSISVAEERNQKRFTIKKPKSEKFYFFFLRILLKITQTDKLIIQIVVN